MREGCDGVWCLRAIHTRKLLPPARVPLSLRTSGTLLIRKDARREGILVCRLGSRNERPPWRFEQWERRRPACSRAPQAHGD